MTAFGAVLSAGLALLALAAAADLVLGARWRPWRRVPYYAGSAASACLTVAGAAAVAGRDVAVSSGAWLGSVAVGGRGGDTVLASAGALAADRLSGLFLIIAFGAAAAVSLAFASWAAGPAGPGRRGLGAGYALALGAIAVVITARDAFTLLFGWESVTLAFWLLAGFRRGWRDRPAAALVTLAFGRVSGACLLAGLLLAVTRSGSLALSSFAHLPAGPARATASVLILAGCAVKVGLVPFQVWMPRGYAAAPGPSRAIMAGVGMNIGLYLLWRSLALLGPPPAVVTGLLLVLAGLTAILGIAHAAVQTSLRRLIAYSSVENAGLILAGFGVALVGAATHSRELEAVGLLAATLQVVAHAFAKSLLFVASASVTAAGHGDDLDDLDGLARRAPWTGTGLAIGSLTLAGLPPTAGFVSEWYLLEALMQQFRLPGLGDRLALAAAGAAVALTAGFAGVTFVRVVGLIVLGGPGRRSRPAAPVPRHQDAGFAGRVGIALLCLACLALAALAPLEIRVIGAGLAPVVPSSFVTSALASPWVLQPVFAGFSILSPSWLWIVMPLLFVIVAGFAWLASGGRLLRVRRVPAWRSATAGVSGDDSYTSFGFANPTRRVLASVLHTRAEVTRLDSGEDGEDVAAHVGYRSDVIEVIEEYGYRPLRRVFILLAGVAQRLQSGRLEAYLAYMLIALIALLAVLTGLR